MLDAPTPVPLAMPRPKVEIELSELQYIRDSLNRLAQITNNNLVRNLFGQVAQMYVNAQQQLKEKACRIPS